MLTKAAVNTPIGNGYLAKARAFEIAKGLADKSGARR
jgi:hypothetical protein